MEAVAATAAPVEAQDARARAFVSPTQVLAGLERIAPANGLRREIFKSARRRRLFGGGSGDP